MDAIRDLILWVVSILGYAILAVLHAAILAGILLVDTDTLREANAGNSPEPFKGRYVDIYV